MRRVNMHSFAMAELMVKLERDCETAVEKLAMQFHIRSEWAGDNRLTMGELNELNIYFNRKYPMYAITVVGNNGILDDRNITGTVILMVGHRVLDETIPDIFHQLYLSAPPNLK
jgi:hypothetical protein